MKNIKQFIAGCITGTLAWALMTVADAADEYLLDTDTFLGFIVFVGLPIIMFIWYIIHYLHYHPKPKKLLLWFGGYFIAFLPIWWIIYNTVNNKTFFITQKDRSDWLNLNGIEYIFYGFTALIAFSVLCLIFHFIFIIIKKIKNHRNKQEN